MPKRSRSESPPSQGKEKGELEIEITTPEDFKKQQAGNSSPTAEKAPRPKKSKTEEPGDYDLRSKRKQPKTEEPGGYDPEKPYQGVVGQEPIGQNRASATAEEAQKVLESRQRDKVDSTVSSPFGTMSKICHPTIKRERPACQTSRLHQKG